jgi:hypothetical protein
MRKTLLPALACSLAVLGFSGAAMANPTEHPAPTSGDHHEGTKGGDHHEGEQAPKGH